MSLYCFPLGLLLFLLLCFVYRHLQSLPLLGEKSKERLELDQTVLLVLLGLFELLFELLVTFLHVCHHFRLLTHLLLTLLQFLTDFTYYLLIRLLLTPVLLPLHLHHLIELHILVLINKVVVDSPLHIVLALVSILKWELIRIEITISGLRLPW